MSIRFLSLFSGIEAASAAWCPLGWECVGTSEIEPFPCAVLKHHYPQVPNLGDVTKITEADILALGKINLVVGGFPCQDLSVAGKRKGLTNEDGSLTRSGLFFDAMRVVRFANPRWLVLENVPGLLSSNEGRDFASLVTEILGVRFDVPPGGWENSGIAVSERGKLEWATLDAQFFGVPQRRRRVFIVGDFGDWGSSPPVLLERYSLQGHLAPRRKAGQNVTGSLSASAGRRCGVDDGERGTLIASNAEGSTGLPFLTSSNIGKHVNKQTPLVHAVDTAPTLRAGGNSTGGDRPPGTDVDTADSLIVTNSAPSYSIQAGATRENSASGPDGVGVGVEIAYTLEARAEVQMIAHSLRGEGFDASEDGTGRGTPLVPVASPIAAYAFQQSIGRNGRGDDGDVVSALTSEAGETGKGDSAPCVAIGFDTHQDPVPSEELFGALTSSSSQAQGVASFKWGMGAKAHGVGYADEQVPTLDTNSDKLAIQSAMQVRRLTPRECERLQEFPDDYTLVNWGNRASIDKIQEDVFKYYLRSGYDEAAAISAAMHPDGPRYKALGNSMHTGTVRWIGERIDMVEKLGITK